MTEMKHVTITKTVPVNNRETLEVWLNREMSKFMSDQRDGGQNQLHAGRIALNLIELAGFTLQSPVTPRAQRS